MEGAAIGAAQRLAEAAPEAELLCPVCGNAMKGTSLAAHLDDKHAGARELPVRWQGPDHASQSVALWLGLGTVVIGLAGIALFPEHDQLILGVTLAPLTLAIGLVLASFAGKLPGTLTLEGDELVLTTLLGMRTRRLRLPPERIEIGQLRVWIESPVGGTDRVERKMGNYLRLTGDGATLVIGARKGTHMGKRWDGQGFAHGPKRQHWHIDLDRRALVHLEYHLAARGGLTPRRAG